MVLTTQTEQREKAGQPREEDEVGTQRCAARRGGDQLSGCVCTEGLPSALTGFPEIKPGMFQAN